MERESQKVLPLALEVGGSHLLWLDDPPCVHDVFTDECTFPEAPGLAHPLVLVALPLECRNHCLLLNKLYCIYLRCMT